jgi:predicted permease
MNVLHSPNFLLIFVCLALGILVRRWGNPPPGLTQGLNWWVLNVALPALVLQLIPRLHLDLQLWFLPAAMWFAFAGAWVLCALAGKALGWPRERIGAVVLVAGLSNSAFTGYPLIEALRGKEALGLAAVADQLGGFLAMTLGGITSAAWYSGARPKALPLLRRIVSFPPFQALIVALIVGRLGGWPDWVNPVLDRIGSTLAPLAVVSVGLQFTLRLTRSELGAAALALAWKLGAASLLIYAGGRAAGVQEDVLAVAVLQAGMSPMISAAIIADQHGLDPPVVNATLGAGILLSLLTVPLLNLLF